jgi:peroxiredoxin
MHPFRTILSSALGAATLAAVACAAPSGSPQGSGDKPVTQREEPKPKEAGAKAAIGKPAPEFELKDLDGKPVKLSDHKGKIVVLEWFDPTCPACGFAYGEKGPLRTLPEKLAKEQGVVWLAVNSAGDQAQGSDVKTNKEFLTRNGVKTTVLLDTKGDVGRAYGAKTTPHVYVIDAKGVLAYQGALDNAPYGKVDGEKAINYVEAAVTALKADKKVEVTETRSYG